MVDQIAFARRVNQRIFRSINFNRGTGCWEWSRGLDASGYGKFTVKKRTVKLHRFIWELFTGEAVPQGKYVLHTCDVRSCCNPEHLFLGTQKENMLDASRKGRLRGWVGTRPTGIDSATSKLSLGQAEEIRNKYEEISPRWGDCSRVMKNIGKDYGVGFTTVRDILAGRRWAA